MFYDLYCELCKQKDLSPSKAAETIGIGKGNVSAWKNKGYTPRGKALYDIADFFGVSADYLLGKEEQKEKAPANDGGRLSVEDRVEQILDGMANEHSGTLMLDGKPASPEALDALRQAIRMGVEYARKINNDKK